MIVPHPAEMALQTALEYDPRLVAARLELIRLYSRQQRIPELDRQCQVLAAQKALDFEHLRFWSLTRNVPWNPEGDLDALARSVAADPDDRASRLALADALGRMGRCEQAETVLAPLADSDADVQLARARLAMNQGDMEGAARLGGAGAETARRTVAVAGPDRTLEAQPEHGCRSPSDRERAGSR